VLHDGSLGDQGAVRLRGIAKRAGAPLTVREVKLSRAVSAKDFGTYTVASSFRLLIPSLFESDDAVLYLDSDLVVHGLDVNELFALVRQQKSPLVAVRDYFISVSESHLRGLEELSLDYQRYFNSGVLGFYMGARHSADSHLLPDFFQWYRSVGRCHHPDQDFLNLRFRDRWLEVDERYNFHVSIHARRMFLPLHQYAGKVLHYAGKAKPLNGYLAPGCVPFWSYASLVPEALKDPDPLTMRYLMPTHDSEHAADALAIRPR
jgi:lipopolysaccharide biosynthesis glycosyltransferase